MTNKDPGPGEIPNKLLYVEGKPSRPSRPKKPSEKKTKDQIVRNVTPPIYEDGNSAGWFSVPISALELAISEARSEGDKVVTFDVDAETAYEGYEVEEYSIAIGGGTVTEELVKYEGPSYEELIADWELRNAAYEESLERYKELAKVNYKNYLATSIDRLKKQMDKVK